MAHHLAIAAVAQTVLKLLEAHGPRELHATPPQFVLHSAGALVPALAEGYSVGVWRVATSPALRHQAAPADGEGPRGAIRQPLELGLLVTPWAADAQRQLGLLGWVMGFAEEHRVLPAALLNQALAGAAPVFGADEAAEIVLDTQAAAEHLALRAQLGPHWPLGLCFTVRTLHNQPARPAGRG